MSGDPRDSESSADNAETPKAEGPAPGWVASDAPVDGTPDPSQGETVAQLGDAITRASQEWLKGRFGLVEDDAGELHVPGPERWPDLGARAEQFIKGFLGGIIAKTPEEREAAAGARDAADVPSGSEVVGRLLSRFSNTVTDTWRDFVTERATHVSDDGKKVVDGEFVLQHGASFLGVMLSRLGEAFQDVGVPGGVEVGPDFATTGPTAATTGPTAATTAEAPTAEAPEGAAQAETAPPEATAPKEAAPQAAAQGTPDIKVQLDLGSIFRAFFSPRR